jgi:hypothetical protein
VTLLGWGVARAIGVDRAAKLHIDRYLLPLVALAVALSFVGLWLELRKAKREADVAAPNNPTQGV